MRPKVIHPTVKDIAANLEDVLDREYAIVETGARRGDGTRPTARSIGSIAVTVPFAGKIHMTVNNNLTGKVWFKEPIGNAESQLAKAIANSPQLIKKVSFNTNSDPYINYPTERMETCVHTIELLVEALKPISDENESKYLEESLAAEEVDNKERFFEKFKQSLLRSLSDYEVNDLVAERVGVTDDPEDQEKHKQKCMEALSQLSK